MPYHLDDFQLRVVRRYSRQAPNQKLLSACRFIILEHVLPTTAEFVDHLKAAGAEIFQFLGKPFSVDPTTLARLREADIPVDVRPYQELETTDYLDQLIAQAVERCAADGRELVFIDVGGYFSAPLQRLDAEAPQYIAGVVEDTTFGHNRYVRDVANLAVPVLSVARSGLKWVEGRFVGRDAVAAMERILRDQGIALAGRRALVIGYGMIGSNVARALRSQDVNVSVYDILDYRNLQAFVDGFEVNMKSELTRHADIIFAATAAQALNVDEIEGCKDDVILASVGSRDTEFDVAALRDQAVHVTQIGEHLERFALQNTKQIVLANRGAAVNFTLPSLPIEILDLVFAEILVGVLRLLHDQAEERLQRGFLHESEETTLSHIAKDWLRDINPRTG
jgi:adenosylhomocysteinase